MPEGAGSGKPTPGSAVQPEPRPGLMAWSGADGLSG
jgi:hypothetical protein